MRNQVEVYRKKFECEGFATALIDGHDVSAVLAALDRAKTTKGRPQAIVARTVKGHGVSFCAGKEHWHGKAFSKTGLATAIAETGGEPVVVPADPGKAYARKALPAPPSFPALAEPEYEAGEAVATREAYGFALKRLGEINPNLVALSGDVKNSTFSEVLGSA